MLITNGFGYMLYDRNVQEDRNNVNSNFRKLFKLRLNDQFLQTLKHDIDNSNRCITLSSLLSTFQRSAYLEN